MGLLVDMGRMELWDWDGGRYGCRKFGQIDLVLNKVALGSLKRSCLMVYD